MAHGRVCKLKGDLTIIIVAHRLNTLLNCDKIFEISEGSLIEKYRNLE